MRYARAPSPPARAVSPLITPLQRGVLPLSIAAPASDYPTAPKAVCATPSPPPHSRLPPFAPPPRPTASPPRLARPGEHPWCLTHTPCTTPCPVRPRPRHGCPVRLALHAPSDHISFAPPAVCHRWHAMDDVQGRGHRHHFRRRCHRHRHRLLGDRRWRFFFPISRGSALGSSRSNLLRDRVESRVRLTVRSLIIILQRVSSRTSHKPRGAVTKERMEANVSRPETESAARRVCVCGARRDPPLESSARHETGEFSL